MTPATLHICALNTPDIDHPITVPPSGMVQPIPIDINGDMRIDLLGVTPSVCPFDVLRRKLPLNCTAIPLGQQHVRRMEQYMGRGEEHGLHVRRVRCPSPSSLNINSSYTDTASTPHSQAINASCQTPTVTL